MNVGGLEQAVEYVLTRSPMQLTSHEYIICQTGSWGPLILSEFTGSYSRTGFVRLYPSYEQNRAKSVCSQQRCIPINPYDKLQFARAINEALTMPEDEKISRWRDLERHVWSQTAQHWCTGFLHALQREAVDVKTRPVQSPREGGEQDSDLPPRFDAGEAVTAFSSSQKRLILLDLEGTLCSDDAISHKAADPGENNEVSSFELKPEVTACLNKLASNPRNMIYIMSGRSSSSLEGLAQQLPSIGFV